MVYKKYILFMLIGATLYWALDGIVQFLQPDRTIRIFSIVWFSVRIFGVPILVAVAWYMLQKKESFKDYPISFPFYMLLGIWVFGPLGMLITSLLMGGDVLDFDNLIVFF